jgi:hypothetical protein
MNTEWTHLRVPKHLHQRLTALAAEMLRNHQEGRSPLPSAYVEHCPVHVAIERLLDEAQAHKTRARQQASRKTRSKMSVDSSVGMLTPVSLEESP